MEQENTAVVEWVDIVDEKNEVVAQATRQQMRAENLRHRATYIVVHDGMGKILAQRRTETKDFYPGWLDATAGGVVQQGENALESARREAEEELGIAGVPLPNMDNSIMTMRVAAFGEAYLVVYHMGHLHYSQKKSRKYAGLLP
ncbi:NUDIX hydrolase [Proteus mirabilis]|uniref:NUDIX hydrolase n=1 Tax=Proteus mirabilis TaxID=584 RepID=A0A379GG07_PROMI|nr:NUDIX hydrolase [Proteus mirabilis]